MGTSVEARTSPICSPIPRCSIILPRASSSPDILLVLLLLPAGFTRILCTTLACLYTSPSSVLRLPRKSSEIGWPSRATDPMRVMTRAPPRSAPCFRFKLVTVSVIQANVRSCVLRPHEPDHHLRLINDMHDRRLSRSNGPKSQ